MTLPTRSRTKKISNLLSPHLAGILSRLCPRYLPTLPPARAHRPSGYGFRSSAYIYGLPLPSFSKDHMIQSRNGTTQTRLFQLRWDVGTWPSPSTIIPYRDRRRLSDGLVSFVPLLLPLPPPLFFFFYLRGGNSIYRIEPHHLTPQKHMICTTPPPQKYSTYFQQQHQEKKTIGNLASCAMHYASRSWVGYETKFLHKRLGGRGRMRSADGVKVHFDIACTRRKFEGFLGHYSRGKGIQRV